MTFGRMPCRRRQRRRRRRRRRRWRVVSSYRLWFSSRSRSLFPTRRRLADDGSLHPPPTDAGPRRARRNRRRAQAGEGPNTIASPPPLSPRVYSSGGSSPQPPGELDLPGSTGTRGARRTGRTRRPLCRRSESSWDRPTWTSRSPCRKIRATESWSRCTCHSLPCSVRNRDWKVLVAVAPWQAATPSRARPPAPPSVAAGDIAPGCSPSARSSAFLRRRSSFRIDGRFLLAEAPLKARSVNATATAAFDWFSNSPRSAPVEHFVHWLTLAFEVPLGTAGSLSNLKNGKSFIGSISKVTNSDNFGPALSAVVSRLRCFSTADSSRAFHSSRALPRHLKGRTRAVPTRSSTEALPGARARAHARTLCEPFLATTAGWWRFRHSGRPA